MIYFFNVFFFNVTALVIVSLCVVFVGLLTKLCLVSFKVFDMHDNYECGGVVWISSKYSKLNYARAHNKNFL